MNNTQRTPSENLALYFLGGLGLVVFFVLLPKELVFTSWRVFGLSLICVGTLYAFLATNAFTGVICALVFAALFEGPLKYGTGNSLDTFLAYLGRDLLIYALTFALFLRSLRSQSNSFPLPPFLFLITCFVLNLIFQLFNPASVSPMVSLLNSRMYWEMLPLYFIGYYFFSTVRDWERLFITLLVVTSINGVVAFYQAALGPELVAAWGAGYYQQIYNAGRIYDAKDGSKMFRPFGLGSDSGFSGSLGVATVPMAICLLVTKRLGQKEEPSKTFKLSLDYFFICVLTVGIVAAIFASDSRSALVLSIAAAGISLVWIQGAARPQWLLAAALIIPLFLFVQNNFGTTLGQRYDSISSPEAVVNTFFLEERNIQIVSTPLDQASRYPLGGGLDNIGPGAAFANNLLGTSLRPQKENTENHLNTTFLGLGIPGAAIWLLLHSSFVMMALRARRQIADECLRTYVGAGAALLILFIPFWFFSNLISFPQNALFWLIAGMVARASVGQNDASIVTTL